MIDETLDTGNRRRAIDKVCTDAALELVCTLAYEKALAGGDPRVIASVEAAILKLRELKVQTTGVYPVLDLDDYRNNADSAVDQMLAQFEGED